MDWQKVVGANVRRMRKARRLSQEQVALQADLDLRYLGGIERGEFNPTVSVLGKLAAVLDAEPGSFFELDATKADPAEAPPSA